MDRRGGHDSAGASSVESLLRALGVDEYLPLLTSAGYFHVSDCAASLTNRRLIELGIEPAGHRELILNCLHPAAAAVERADSTGAAAAPGAAAVPGALPPAWQQQPPSEDVHGRGDAGGQGSRCGRDDEPHYVNCLEVLPRPAGSHRVPEDEVPPPVGPKTAARSHGCGSVRAGTASDGQPLPCAQLLEAATVAASLPSSSADNRSRPPAGSAVCEQSCTAPPHQLRLPPVSVAASAAPCLRSDSSDSRTSRQAATVVADPREQVPETKRAYVNVPLAGAAANALPQPGMLPQLQPGIHPASADNGSDDYRPVLPPKVSVHAGWRGQSVVDVKGSKPLPRPRVLPSRVQSMPVQQQRRQPPQLPTSFAQPTEAVCRATDSVIKGCADECRQPPPHGVDDDAAAAAPVADSQPLPSACSADAADDCIAHCRSDLRVPAEAPPGIAGATGPEHGSAGRLRPAAEADSLASPEADSCVPMAVDSHDLTALAAGWPTVAEPPPVAAQWPLPKGAKAGPVRAARQQQPEGGKGQNAGRAADGLVLRSSDSEADAEPGRLPLGSLPPAAACESQAMPAGIAVVPKAEPRPIVGGGPAEDSWRSSCYGSIPEPSFPPPSLPPAPATAALSLTPVVPKRKSKAPRHPTTEPGASVAQVSEAPAAATAAALAAAVASAAATAATAANDAHAAVTAACSGHGPPGGDNRAWPGGLTAPVDRVPVDASGFDKAAVEAEVEVGNRCQPGLAAAIAITIDGTLRDHGSRDQGWQDCVGFSTSQLFPLDPFADAWSSTAAADQAAAAALPFGDQARPTGLPSADLTWLSAMAAADTDWPWPADGSKLGRLSDSLPLTQLFPGTFDSSNVLGVDDDVIDDYCSFTENSLYGSWGVLNIRSWDTGEVDQLDTGADGCESDGSQDESGDDCSSYFRSTDNLAELANDASTADSDGKRSPSSSIPTAMLQTPKSPLTPRSIHRAGYLYKQGGVQHNKGWRKRYVTFDGQVLKYFSDKKSRISKRIVPLTTMVEVTNDIKETDSNRFRFLLKCINRVFWFAAETLEDSHLWASTIMQAILLSQPVSKARGGGLKPGGDMSDPDVYGNVFMDGSKNRRFVAIKGGRLCYYNNFYDFKLGSPIHQVDMEIASVKDLGKMRLQLSTPYHQYILTFSVEDETQLWKTAIEDSIATALSDDTVLSAVYQNDFNQKCADCNSPNPHWSVLHLVVVICKKCAGIHRQIWPFNVKSLRMDLRVWTPDLVQLFTTYGNGCANNLWEWDLPPMLKITESADLHSRQAFIQNKYQRKSYFRLHPLASDLSKLNKALLRCVQTDSISETLQLIHSGANITARDEAGQNAVDLARAVHQPLQTELLKHISLDLDQGTVYTSQSQSQGRAVQRIIMKSGYLTELERKEGIRRWVVLDLEAMSYYQDENMPTLKGIIRMSEVVSIRKRENEKYLPLFSITMLSDGGKDVTLAADSYEGLHGWMESLYKVQTKLLRIADFGGLSSVATLTGSDDYTMAGSVFIKEGTGATWQRTWLVIQGKVLVMCDITTQKVDHADLRKVVKMMITKQDFSGSLSADLSGTVLVIDLPNRALYIQSDLHFDTQSWMQAIRKACQENTQSLGDQQLTNDNVVVAVDTCINFISTYAMRVEGIYRLCGTQSAVTHLLESFIKDARAVHLKAEGTSVHEVTGVLKGYLRSLTEPLMTAGLHQRWLDTVAVKDTDRRQDEYKGLLAQLPPVNYCTLKRLIGHLKRVSELSDYNKMTVANLGTVFGPLLMTSAGEAMNAAHYAQTGKAIQIVCELITCYQSLFEVDNKELEKERKMEEYILKLQQAQQQMPAAAPSASSVTPFILGIYEGSSDGKCVTVKVVTNTTASEVMMAFPAFPSAYMITDLANANLSAVHALFEVVGNGELERQLDASDAVLPVTLRWGSWGESYRRSVLLCAKPSSSLWIDADCRTFPECSRYNDVQHCSGKSWNKVHVEVAHGFVSYYKPGKSSSTAAAAGWHVHDIVIYAGVEEKRRAPTRFGTTVLLCEAERPVEKSGPPHGHSFCFNTQAELQVWMANIRYAKACTPKTISSDSGLHVRDGSHGSVDNLSIPGSEKSKVSVVLNHLRSFKLSSILK